MYFLTELTVTQRAHTSTATSQGRATASSQKQLEDVIIIREPSQLTMPSTNIQQLTAAPHLHLGQSYTMAPGQTRAGVRRGRESKMQNSHFPVCPPAAMFPNSMIWAPGCSQTRTTRQACQSQAQKNQVPGLQKQGSVGVVNLEPMAIIQPIPWCPSRIGACSTRLDGVGPPL